MSDDPVEKIDILHTELTQELPHWLSPQARFAHKHEDQRARNRAKHAAELNAKIEASVKAKEQQQQAAAKAKQKESRDYARRARWDAIRRASDALLSLRVPGRLTSRYNPEQPRDEYGRWTDGGASEDPSRGGGEVGAPRHSADVPKVEAKTKANVAVASAAALERGEKHLLGSHGNHPATIASRRPSAKNSPDVYGQPDVASMGLDPEQFEHNVGLFKNADFYPNFRAKDLNGSVDKQARAIVDHMKSNLKFLYQFADHHSNIWYDGARALVDDRAQLWGFNDASIAGVYAALSPQKDWDMNVHLGDMMMRIYKEKQDFRWDAKMEAASKTAWSAKDQPTVDLVRDKTLGELTSPEEKAIWIKVYSVAHDPTHYRVVLPDGRLNGIARGKPPKGKPPSAGKPKEVVWQTLPSMIAAIEALEANGDRKTISDAFGDKHKIRSFYNNILDPHSANGDVTIDTHAVGAALLRVLGGSSPAVVHNFGTGLTRKEQPEGYVGSRNSTKTGSMGTYGLYADAYREAAKELNIEPRQLQSAVWVVKREALGELSEAKVAEIDDAWREYHDDPKITLEATQHKIARIAGLEK